MGVVDGFDVGLAGRVSVALGVDVVLWDSCVSFALLPACDVSAIMVGNCSLGMGVGKSEFNTWLQPLSAMAITLRSPHTLTVHIAWLRADNLLGCVLLDDI